MAEQVSSREVAIATAVSLLTDKEKAAYAFSVKRLQAEIPADQAEEMYQLYVQGKSCEQIRTMYKGYSIGQVVVARVVHGWDEKREEHRLHQQQNIPTRALHTQLEAVDYLSDILGATMMLHRENIQKYMATGDKTYLKDVPLPSNPKEFKLMLDTFMAATGQDNKKQVVVSGKVTVDHGGKVSPDEAMDIMDKLLGEVVDVDVEDPKDKK